MPIFKIHVIAPSYIYALVPASFPPISVLNTGKQSPW